MKIFMLNPTFMPGFCRSARWAARSRGRVQRHPDWMLVATSVLEKAGHSVKFLDAQALDLGYREIENGLKDFRPELVVIHTTTPTIYSDISYAKQIKQDFGSTLVLIGAHVSAETDDTFRIAKNSIDIIVRGEYDYALRDIAEGKSLAEIEGISYLKDGQILHNKERPCLDINELPFPAWQHIKPEWYRDSLKRYPFLTLISARGCYGRCSFCRDVQVMEGRILRTRRAKDVADEMEYDLKLFPYIKEIMFETSTFAALPEHTIDICDEIMKRGLKITWSCNVRPDMDLSLLPIMKKAGCRMLVVGFEFGRQNCLDIVKKGMNIETSVKFAETAHKLGLFVHGCFMIGAPGEDRDSAQATIDFAKFLPIDSAQFSGIVVYPGTELYHWAKENGFLLAKDWSQWVTPEGEQATVLSYPQLSKEEIDRFIDKALKEFYFRPKQIVRMLKNIKDLQELRNKISGLKSFATYLLSKKLKACGLQPEARD